MYKILLIAIASILASCSSDKKGDIFGRNGNNQLDPFACAWANNFTAGGTPIDLDQIADGTASQAWEAVSYSFLYEDAYNAPVHFSGNIVKTDASGTLNLKRNESDSCNGSGSGLITSGVYYPALIRRSDQNVLKSLRIQVDYNNSYENQGKPKTNTYTNNYSTKEIAFGSVPSDTEYSARRYGNDRLEVISIKKVYQSNYYGYQNYKLTEKFTYISKPLLEK